MKRLALLSILTAGLALDVTGAQAQVQAQVQAGGQAGGQAGAWSPPATGSTAAPSAAPARRSSGVRIAVQARLDMLNMFGATDSLVVPSAGGGVAALIGQVAPYVTPGVRLVDGKLFLGLGLGFLSYSDARCENPACDTETTRSRSGFSLSPLVTFDLIQRAAGALYLLGWLNVASIGDSTTELRTPAGTTDTTPNDGSTGFGFNIGAGIRGALGDNISLGTEFGYGFLSFGEDATDSSTTFHGFFGTILIEASLGV